VIRLVKRRAIPRIPEVAPIRAPECRRDARAAGSPDA